MLFENNKKNMLKPSLGRNVIKILPFLNENKENPQYFITYKGHYLHCNGGIVVCPKTWGESCPICDFSTTQNVDTAIYTHLKAKQRTLYNIIDLSDGAFNSKVQIYDVSTWLFHRKLIPLIEQHLAPPELDSTTPTVEDTLNYLLAMNECKRQPCVNTDQLANRSVRFTFRKNNRFFHEYNNLELARNPFANSRKKYTGTPWNLQELIDNQHLRFEEVYDKLMAFLKSKGAR